MRAIKGVSASAAFLLLAALLLLTPAPALAQGVGFFQRPNCASLTASVAGSTLCWDTTNRQLLVYNGVNYATVTALNVAAFGAAGDGTTDDTTAINNAFAFARNQARNFEIYFPCASSYYLVTSSINAGGFGNAPPTVRGCGSKNLGAIIHGKFATAGQAVVDFSGNEGGQILDLRIEGDSTTTPDIGLLLAGATVGGTTRGGANYLQNVQVAGVYNKAAIAVRSADLVVFNHVIAGLQVPSGSGGVALYVVNGAAVTPVFPISSAFRTLSDATGVTSFSSIAGVYSLAGNLVAGTTNRAAWLVDGVSRQINSTNDHFIFGGITGSAVEFIDSGGSLFMLGFTHESGGGSFLKTDGFKNSLLIGYVQQNGTTPLIDLASTYGSGAGNITNSTINLSPSDSTAKLLNCAANCGLVGNTITLSDNSSLSVTGGATQANLITNNGAGTVTLRNSNSNDRGNVVINGGNGTGTPPQYVSDAGVLTLLVSPASVAVGDLLFASATTPTWARLADVAAGSYLLSGGVNTAPLWSTLTLPNAATTGDVLIATGTNAIGRLADVAAGSYLRSAGAGVAPLWSTLILPNAATANRVVVATSTNNYGESVNFTFDGTTLSLFPSVGGGTLTLYNAATLGFSSGGGSADTLVSRNSAGVINVTTGYAAATVVGTSATYTMCKTGACLTTCTIVTTGGLVTSGTCNP